MFSKFSALSFQDIYWVQKFLQISLKISTNISEILFKFFLQHFFQIFLTVLYFFSQISMKSKSYYNVPKVSSNLYENFFKFYIEISFNFSTKLFHIRLKFYSNYF